MVYIYGFCQSINLLQCNHNLCQFNNTSQYLLTTDVNINLCQYSSTNTELLQSTTHLPLISTPVADHTKGSLIASTIHHGGSAVNLTRVTVPSSQNTSTDTVSEMVLVVCITVVVLVFILMIFVGGKKWYNSRSDKSDADDMVVIQATSKKRILVSNPYVIIVGIENYANGGWSSLVGVKKDVYNMAKLWNKSYNYNSMSIVCNFNSNKDQEIESQTVKNALNKEFGKYVLANADCHRILNDKNEFQDYLLKIRAKIDTDQINDGLLFVYSGHGIKNAIVLGNGESYKILNIVNMFNNEQCKQIRGAPKVVIFDCCRGSGIAQTFEIEKPLQLRGNSEWKDKRFHINSGVAMIFSNFENFAVQDSSVGGCLIRAIVETFKNPNQTKYKSLHELIIDIRGYTKEYAGRGNKDLDCPAQIVEYRETLEYMLFFQRSNN